MGDICKLRASIGIDAICDKDACVYWRVAEHLDIDASVPGCAIEYFELLGDSGSGVAEWLLSVKERVERESAALQARDVGCEEQR
ncbi:MAG: hypothetical protein OEV43_07080 [Coriobacteriia bacterium]|nr:hypothetical protein [Coriobacteriia bacterium]